MTGQNKAAPPEGAVTKTADWITQNLGDKENVQKYFLEIFPEQKVTYKEPTGIDPPLWHSECYHPSGSVSVIPNGRLWGQYTVITPDNKLLWEACYSLDDQPESCPIFQQKTLSPIKYYDKTVATIAWAGQGNFYHWFYDILPRIYLLRKSGIKIDKYVVNAYAHHPQTLEILGIPKEKQIPVLHPETNFHIQAKELIIPSAKFNCAKWAIDFIRNEFLSKLNVRHIDGYDRIYISREDASYRKIKNDDEVLEVLKKYGFRKVLLGSLPLEEQFSIFHSAKVIVAPIGAASTSITFCKPGTKFIEMIYSEGHAFNGFWQICNHLNMDYYFFTCNPVPPLKEHPNHNDIVIDIDKLMNTLKLANIH